MEKQLENTSWAWYLFHSYEKCIPGSDLLSFLVTNYMIQHAGHENNEKWSQNMKSSDFYTNSLN